MKDAQKPDHVSLNTLINRLREGRFVIPDFQREFEWQPWDIRDLVRSVFLDYYIGSLLLWKSKRENFNALSCEPLYGHTGTSNVEYIVLDGQQRLTAMFYAFLAPDMPLPNRSKRCLFFIDIDAFMSEDYDLAFNYEWFTQRWAKVLNNRDAQYEAHLFPLSIIGAGGWDLPNWVQGYEAYWKMKSEKAQHDTPSEEAVKAQRLAGQARAFGEHVKAITEQYQISYIELDRDLAVDKVCDIFTQINSRGVRLDVFDLINALTKPKGLRLKHMWREASKQLQFVETEKMNVYILQVMSILRQGYCSPKYLYFLLPGQERPIRGHDGTRHKDILIPTSDDFVHLWTRAVNALRHAIDLLRHPQEFGAVSSNYLPYVSILPVFAALQERVKTSPAHQRLSAQRKIRHWYWASVFTNRYSGAVESTSARDYQDVVKWIDDDQAEPTLLLEFKTRFRNLELRNEVRRGTSRYNGIFNLLILQGARDWVTGKIPQHGDLDDHHIVPSSWGLKAINGNGIHTILNRTPLSADTNRNIIKDRLPNIYLREWMKTDSESAVRNILASHFISPAAFDILLRDPFTAEDFEAFISERQRSIQEGIENLLIKERIDLTPTVRELDQQIERIELMLRSFIVDTIGDSEKPLPLNVQTKIDERIQNETRKNAALDSDQLRSLNRKLEYADLRELQDIIANKTLWAEFQPRFINKETFVSRFNQLAELRNTIRHSRTVNDIVRKDGEAAILWFSGVLAK